MVAEVTKQSQIETQPPMSTKSTLPPSHSHPQVGRQQQLHATHSNTGKLLLDSIQKIYNIDPISGSIISLMNWVANLHPKLYRVIHDKCHYISPYYNICGQNSIFFYNWFY